MKYQVDQDLCIGCGMCESLCPDVFRINEEGKAEVFGEGDGSSALESCPASAISEAAEEAAAEAAEETQETVTEESGKYVCTICGYVYDPAAGDPDRGIEPGTAFEDLPEDWTCPLCAVGKDLFEKE